MRVTISEDSDNLGGLRGVGIWLQIDNNETFELKGLRYRFLGERRDKGLSGHFFSQRLKTHSYLAGANSVHIPDHNLRRRRDHELGIAHNQLDADRSFRGRVNVNLAAKGRLLCAAIVAHCCSQVGNWGCQNA